MTKAQSTAYHKAYYKKNKDKVDKQNKDAKSKRLDQIKAYNKAYYAKTRAVRIEQDACKATLKYLPFYGIPIE